MLYHKKNMTAQKQSTVWGILTQAYCVLGGLGFVFMRGKGPGGPGSGNDSSSDKESNYTELDDLITGKDEENQGESK